MFALDTYSFQTIKLKIAAFLPSAAQRGRLLLVHVFEGFFGLENGPVKSNKSQVWTHSKFLSLWKLLQNRSDLLSHEARLLRGKVTRSQITSPLLPFCVRLNDQVGGAACGVEGDVLVQGVELQALPIRQDSCKSFRWSHPIESATCRLCGLFLPVETLESRLDKAEIAGNLVSKRDARAESFLVSLPVL